MCPVHWPTQSEQCWVMRPGTCSDASLILPVPFVWGQNRLWVMCPGICHNDLAGMPEHLDRVPTYPMEVEEVVNNGVHWLLWPGEFSKLPQSSWQPPSLLYLIFFSCLLFRSCSFSPPLSHRSNCSQYTYSFEFVCERGQVQHPPTPPSQPSFLIFFLIEQSAIYWRLPSDFQHVTVLFFSEVWKCLETYSTHLSSGQKENLLFLFCLGKTSQKL